jgi:hypothetical protein
MSGVAFSCANCGHKLKARADQAGKHCQCTRCAHRMSIPAAPPGRAPSRRSRLIFAAVLACGLLVLAGILVLVFRPAGTPDVDQCLSDLKGTDPDARARAVVCLADAEPADRYRSPVTAALEPLLFDGDLHGTIQPDVLLRAYLHWADPNNVPALVRMVDNPTLPSWDAKKTAQVLETLGNLQDPRAVDVLVRQLSSPALHEAAFSALRLMGPQAEPAVVDAFFDGDPAPRRRAGDLLANYHTKPTTVAAAALARLKSRSPDVRLGVAGWFAENAPDNEAQQAEGARLLTGLLDELSPKANALALRGLKLWAIRDSLAPLVGFAQRQVRAAPGPETAANNGLLLDVLAQFSDATAAGAIAPMLRDPGQRARAVQVLLKFGPLSVDAVLPYLNHPDPDVRKEVRRLAKTLSISDERQIEQSLADVADPRKVRSRTALEHLASLRPDEAHRAKVSRALNAPLLDSDPGIRAEAARAVAVWASRDNTATLVKILAAFQGGPKEELARIDLVSRALVAIGPGVEDAVCPLLQSPERMVRCQACRILEEVGTLKSVGPLQEAVRRFAIDERFCDEALMVAVKIKVRN